MTSPHGDSLCISDPEFLEDYVTFGLWQPAFMSHWLYTQAASATTAKASFALQMYINVEMTLEALSKWYFALRDWTPGCEPLLWRFKRTEVRERPEAEMREKPEAKDYATDVALTELAYLSPEEILSRLKQPSDEQLKDRCWTKGEIIDRSRSVGKLLQTLREALDNRRAGDGDVIRGYNNLKHGLLVLHQLPKVNHESSAFLIAKVQKGQGGQSLITPLRLSTHPEKMHPLRSTTIATCQLIAVLLALIPWYYYSDLSWPQYKARPGNLIGALTTVFERIDGLVASP